MHGNVEEWCQDWYGPYIAGKQTDPIGRETGDFRVTRGGAHSTTLEFLRSSNRLGTLPEDKSWLIGFRVVQAEMPRSTPWPPVKKPLHARNVKQQIPADLAKGADPAKPYFYGPRIYVKQPDAEDCPVFNRHNHCPAIVNCPNGDLLAIWYTCAREPGRELGIVASRLRHGEDEWEAASTFWDAPDRNDHASALWVDEKGTLYHFNGLAAAGTWGSLATIMRTSTDKGASWSKARLIMPEHGVHHMPIESVIRTKEGAILVPCDAVPGGQGGSALLVSRDHGNTWVDPGEGRPGPTFEAGATGAWIAGLHAGFVQRTDGTLMAFGRGNNINDRMPTSVSKDLGENWTYAASPFPPIGTGQRLVVLRLHEGPILLCSFSREVSFRDAAGNEQIGSGLFAALSDDDGETWEIMRLITDDGPPRLVDGGGNTGNFTMSALSAETRGYMSICQAADSVIHLISSKQHYAFNLAWLQTPAPPPPAELEKKAALEKVYRPKQVPTKDGWRFNGTKLEEADAVRVQVDGGTMAYGNGAMTQNKTPLRVTEKQVTDAPHGHILTNFGAWSADREWIVYDVRSDPAGSVSDGERIERVHAKSGKVETLYTLTSGACCVVVTASPVDDRVVFIHGPENPTPDWSYAARHRRGVIVHADTPSGAENLDARDLTEPMTPGALRGGTHVHTFSGDGQWIAFTYEDHVLAELGDGGGHDLNQRNIGVSVPAGPVAVKRDHPRNHDGSHFTVLVAKTVNHPRPGSDEINRAFEDGWVGVDGYVKLDGTRQRRAIAFQGQVVAKDGQSVSEVFLVDLPDDLTVPGDAPLEGTATTRPAPPQGAVQRRLTFTTDRKYPGIQGPRHWLRSSPDGSRIAFLMKDDDGIVQIWTISPNGGEPRQVTHNAHDVASAFTWSPDGRWIAHTMDGCVCVTDTSSGDTHRLTAPSDEKHAPRPEACVFSPDGTRIAYVSPVTKQGQTWNQIFVLTLEGNDS